MALWELYLLTLRSRCVICYSDRESEKWRQKRKLTAACGSQYLAGIASCEKESFILGMTDSGSWLRLGWDAVAVDCHTFLRRRQLCR
jgi:hypothetical protein